MADVEAVTEERTDPREKRTWWSRWIRGAKKAAKNHWDDAKDAWDEYENAKPGANVASDQYQLRRAHPIYWASCKGLESALYAGPPSTDTKRLFDIEDDIALTASLIAERLGDTFIEESDFDNLVPKVIGDFLHADKATAQLIYEKSGGMILSQDGQEYPEHQRVYAAPLLYDEVLHTPKAKSPDEITEEAYHFCLPRAEAEKRFPEAKDINWKTSKSGNQDKERDSEDEKDETPGEYLEGWECWSRTTGRVYWYSDQYDADLLDAVDDPYKLRGFFPRPKYIISSKPAKHLYPTPCFKQVQSIIDEMHELVRKTFKLIRAVRRRALVDDSDPNLIAALNTIDDNEFIACSGVRSLVEKGGLDSMIWFIPVQELIQHLAEISELEAKFKDSFYEWFGYPDILRGVSDPRETARAQGIKQASAFGRFEMPILQVAKLVADTIEMGVDLMLGVYPDEKIMLLTGFEFMSDEHKARFPEALAMLRRDDMRIVRVHISTDQLSSWSRQQKQQQKNAIAEIVTQGLGNIAKIAKDGDPEFVNVSLQMLLKTLEQMEGGRDFFDEVKGAVSALMDKLNQPPPEPGPDYEQMKIDIEGRKVQVAEMKAQMDNMVKQRDLERREFEASIKDRDSQLVGYVKQVEAQLSERIQSFTEYIGQAQLELEQYKTALVEREKLIEEQRLAYDTQLEQQRQQIDAMQQAPAPEPTPPQIIQIPPAPTPPIMITVENKQGTKRILRDPLTGDITGVTDDPPAVPIVPLGV